MVPREIAAELDELNVLSVQFADNLRAQPLVE
jgi:hypothetical protein